MKQKLVIYYSNRSIPIILCLAALLEPTYFARVFFLDMIYTAGKLLSFCYVTLRIFKQKNIKFKNVDGLLIFYFAYLLILTVLICDNFISQVISLMTPLVLCLVVIIEVKSDCHRLLKCLSNVAAFYMLLNFVTLLIWPDGLYKTISLHGHYWDCWLLGYKNPMSRFVLLTLGINISKATYEKGKIGVREILLIAIGIYSAIKVDSATSIVAIFIMICFILLPPKIRIPGFLNLRNVFIIGGIMTFLIVEFNFQEYFSYLIVTLLHRSLTLTERIYTWNRAIEYIHQSILFGYGVENGTILAEKIGATHTHNYYLYQLYIGGVVGFMIILAFINVISKKLKSKGNMPVARMYFGIISATFVIGLTESLTQTHLFYPTLLLAYYVPQMCNTEHI